MSFRARPHRSESEGHVYRGKAELTLTSYGLHDDELSVLRRAVEANILRDSIQMGAGEATDALDSLVHRIEQLVNPQSLRTAANTSPEINPSSALLAALREVFHWLSGQRTMQPLPVGDYA